MQQLLLNIEWTDDCQGKKDYDGDILSISTRYWPRGGGFTLISTGPPLAFQENDTRPEVRPSATSELVLRHKPLTEGGYRDWSVLATQDFEADTQEEVQHQVEAWAQAQMDRVVAILQEHFTISQDD